MYTHRINNGASLNVFIIYSVKLGVQRGNELLEVTVTLHLHGYLYIEVCKYIICRFRFHKMDLIWCAYRVVAYILSCFHLRRSVKCNVAMCNLYIRYAHRSNNNILKLHVSRM